MKKRASIIAIALLIAVFLSIIPVHAADLDPYDPEPDVPEYIDLVTIYSQLTISSSGLATCVAGGRTNKTDTLYLTITLYRQNGTGVWTATNTWNTSGYRTISAIKSAYVLHGYNYRVQATIAVYNSSGNFVESVSKWSSIVFY